MSKLAQELFKLLGIQHITVSRYAASSNGRVENLNSHFLKCIRALGKDELSKWPSYLPMIEFAQRIQHSKSLNASPYFTMYCQEPRTIFDAKFLSHMDKDASLAMNEQLLPRVKFMRELMSKNLKNANERTMQCQHKKSKHRPFQIGDRVFRKCHKRIKGVTSSHLPIFEGPFVIIHMDRDMSAKYRKIEILMHQYCSR